MTTISDNSRPDTDTALLGRYLIGTLGAAAIGLGAALVLPRRQRAIIGGTLLATGFAMLARGVSGRWPTVRIGATLAEPPASSLSTATGDELQGEGDHRAARRYGNQVRDFIGEGRVEAAAIEAAWAVDDPAAPSLAAPDDTGKFSPTTGRF